MTEAGGMRVIAWVELVHTGLVRWIGAQSYIGVAAAKMEICGRARECLGRVKGATEIKIVMIVATN
jgi:hypothetical protein